MPKKSVFTLTEVVLLSIVWSSTSFAWQSILKQGLSSVYSRLGLGKYPTDILVALTLLAAVYAMILLFKNVNVGRSTVFQLVDVYDPPALVPKTPRPGAEAPPDPGSDSGVERFSPTGSPAFSDSLPFAG